MPYARWILHKFIGEGFFAFMTVLLVPKKPSFITLFQSFPFSQMCPLASTGHSPMTCTGRCNGWTGYFFGGAHATAEMKGEQKQLPDYRFQLFKKKSSLSILNINISSSVQCSRQKQTQKSDYICQPWQQTARRERDAAAAGNRDR